MDGDFEFSFYWCCCLFVAGGIEEGGIVTIYFGFLDSYPDVGDAETFWDLRMMKGFELLGYYTLVVVAEDLGSG